MIDNGKLSSDQLSHSDSGLKARQSSTEPPSGLQAGISIAVASFILGLLSLSLSFLVIGAGMGLFGLILGIGHLSKKKPFRAMAIWGLVLSAIGTVVGIGFGVFYGITFYRFYRSYSTLRELPEQRQVEEYIGTAVSDVTLTDIEGNNIILSKLKGKRVILDFWATWCPPCKKEIPHFIRLANETKSDNLVIIGISSEDKNVLEDFVKKNDISYPIVSADNLPSPFDEISSVPTTFFIDRKGVIQKILVGYQDYDTLKAAASAEDYQGEPNNVIKKPQVGLRDSGIKYIPKLEWTLNIPGAVSICAGNWGSDEKEKILVADRDGSLHIISKGGRTENIIKIPSSFSQIEVGKHKQHGCMLLGYSNWGKKVTVVDTNGMTLWEYEARTGVDGAHFGDLDGDNTDELIVGMNGSGGLVAISSDGKQRWKVSDIGNVWNQAVVTGRDPKHTFVFATEAGGTIKVFDSNGQLIRSLRPVGKYYAQMTASLVDTNDNIQVIAIGDGIVVAFDPTGKVSWTTPGEEGHGGWRSTSFACGDINQDGQKEWVFHEANGDLVIVKSDGIKIASLPGQKSIDGFVVCSGLNGYGCLVTMGGGKIYLYSLNK
jgi:peroxiredoxin